MIYFGNSFRDSTFLAQSRQELLHQKPKNDNSELLQQATTNFWNGVICYVIYKIDKISQKQTFMPPSTYIFHSFHKMSKFLIEWANESADRSLVGTGYFL